MIVQFPCLVCNRVIAKDFRVVQCRLCDSWDHIACNNLNLYTYRKLKKDKSLWYCMCYFQKELPYGSINDTKLRILLYTWRSYCLFKPYRAVTKNLRAVQCNLWDSWVHIACNNLNLYTY